MKSREVALFDALEPVCRRLLHDGLGLGEGHAEVMGMVLAGMGVAVALSAEAIDVQRKFLAVLRARGAAGGPAT